MEEKERSIEAAKQAISDTERVFRAAFNLRKTAEELRRIAFSDVADYVEIGPGGEMQAKALEDIRPKKKTRAIKWIREKTTIKESADGATISKHSQVEYVMHDKLAALKLGVDLAGYTQPQRHEITMPGVLKIDEITPERRELAKLAAKMAADLHRGK
ncbi:MAG: hypothetical protein AVO39_10285 [delta proteobacterium MLS_D]|jgi:hypothetical protein|nr:MAG: hypothetical protein AVO39_10285 [delta proteobacterium MLS_D]